MAVVCLASVPPRFSRLGEVLDSLLAQRPRPERVIVTLRRRYRRFPGADVTPPALPEGVEVHWLEDDPGPIAKVAPVLRLRPQTDVVWCDDDCLYEPGWLAALLAARRSPHEAVAASAWSVRHLKRQGTRLAGLADIAEGWAGVLLRAGRLPREALKPPPPALYADDIWISALLARDGIAIRPLPAARRLVVARDAAAPLQDAAPDGWSRARAYREAAEAAWVAFGVWPPAAGVRPDRTSR